MKKIVSLLLALALLLPAMASAEIDLSALSFDELVDLNQKISQELTTKPEWREVTVPQGVWEVGKDIPAGHWRISAYPGTSGSVTIGDTLSQTLKDISYYSKFYYSASVSSPSYRYYQENVDKSSIDIDLYNGLYVIVDNASVVFSPYQGKPLLGFFSTLSKSEKSDVGSTTTYKLKPGLYCIGDDIPGGTYDVRYGDGDQPLTLTYSDILGSDGKPDLSFFYSYTISVDTEKWTGGAHPVIMLDSYGYLLVEGRSCRLYPEKMGY